MKNPILNYEKFNRILNNIVLESRKCIPLIRQKSIKTRFGYTIPYYTLGNGIKNIVIVGGTHGSEIITVDFVLNLMKAISRKKNYFKNINIEKYKFHFIPLQNPEGFIISTSVINKKINDTMDISKIESICKNYYSKYKSDDINVLHNNYDRCYKEHQKMFSLYDYNSINNKHRKLKKNIERIYSNKNIPRGSIIVHRGNGSCIELNRNTKNNECIKYIKQNKKIYGEKRYNNILTTIEGPIGLPCKNINKFSYEKENIFLLNLFESLNSKLFIGLLFHSTGGEIYYKPINKKCWNSNYVLANIYSKYTNYSLMENKDKNFSSFDGCLRTKYKNILLIELSKMGGNPLGPYGDIENNYKKVINDNLKAVSEIIKFE